ncbi:hypothetical protein E2562_021856 [Oryza meyeriana var. granulata]|uniref:Uncharacterized protein n=1 Tax=Oryza meyeriana var. granulata TaxID=110450 RepID=A0A6G1C7Y9_9ORYZ|nr:hypothetical protein E2562_021856 [Oryza meyeriana var. granulata]
MPLSLAAARAASPSNSSSASASDFTPSWWESVSQARSRILTLSSILPSLADSDVAVLADSDRPACALLRSPATYAALSAALRSGGSADDPACHWLYDTLLSRTPTSALPRSRSSHSSRRYTSSACCPRSPPRFPASRPSSLLSTPPRPRIARASP